MTKTAELADGDVDQQPGPARRRGTDLRWAIPGALVAAATAIAIPGIGLVVAGPIAGAIAGAGAGGATGTLVGALIGAGIPENRAAEYERGLKEGGIVLGTRAKDQTHATALEREFTGHGARNVLR